jgi:glutamyl-tRNA reductase
VIVIVVGLNHRTVPLHVLERTSVQPARLGKALDDLVGREHLNGAVVLSTCHRTEIYASVERFHGAVQDIRNFLAETAGLPPEDIADHLYAYYDEAAAAHLFGVVSGLDSVVIGESEILGQVRDAWNVSQGLGTCPTSLSTLFRHAVEVGKRARSETGISRRITSVSQAAVAMADDRLGGLAGRRVLVLGAGDMGESMAVALAGNGGASVLVANRTRAKAAALADRVGGADVALDEVPEHLADVDVLLTSTNATDAILDRSDLEPIVARRAGRPLLVVDVAMPRDVDPGVADLSGVTLLDLDDLKAFVAEGLDERRKEVGRVSAIISEEVERYLARSTAREMAPAITALRRRADDIRNAELERFRSRLDGLDDREREAVEALTKGIVAKLLHEPTVQLKAAAGDQAGLRLTDALRTLFDLE